MNYTFFSFLFLSCYIVLVVCLSIFILVFGIIIEQRFTLMMIILCIFGCTSIKGIISLSFKGRIIPSISLRFINIVYEDNVAASLLLTYYDTTTVVFKKYCYFFLWFLHHVLFSRQSVLLVIVWLCHQTYR